MKQDPNFITGKYRPGMFRMMYHISRRSIRRKFHGAWLVPSEPGQRPDQAFDGINEHHGPAIMIMNHASWWDPLVGLLLHGEFLGARSICGPMDADQLRKFRIFRGVGLFGIDPDDPASLELMSEWVDTRFREDGHSTFWITPQGEFTDPRQTVKPRPGVAAIAARHPGIPVVSIAIEYPFILDSKPEVCMRIERVPNPENPSTSQWQRVIRDTMQHNGERLAEQVITRDSTEWQPIIGAGKASVHPLYNLWLRMRGRSTAIKVDHRTEPKHDRS